MNAPQTFDTATPLRFPEVCALMPLPIPTPWHEDTDAVALLADCGRNPPAYTLRHSDWYCEKQKDYDATDSRVERLEAIREAHGEAALGYQHKTGNGEYFVAWCFEHPELADAIDAAVEAADSGSVGK